jgi:tetratricopeptide (TPR) repeat protein/cell division protein FtsL
MERFKKGIMLCLLLICNTILLAQHKNVFKLPFPQQYVTIDKIIDTLTLQDSKLALKRLKQLELQAYETNVELSILNYKRSEIRYRYIRTIGYEKRPILNQLIQDSEKLISTIDEQQYPVIAALLHFQIGNSLDYQKYNYKEQFKHYLKAYDLFKNIPLKLFPYRYYSQYAIALAYYQFGEYEKAISLSNEVESLFPKKDFNSILTVNLIGLSYLELKKYNQAIISFKWILKNKKYALNPNAWKGISLCNLGNVYYIDGNNTKAIHYLTQGIQIVKQEEVFDNLASASIILAKIYILQKNSFEAKKYLDLVNTVNSKISSTKLSYNLNKILSNYYELEGNSKMSLYHLQLANTYKDSLDISTNVNKRFKAEMNFENEKHTLIVNKIKNQRIIEVILFLFTLLFLTTLFIFYDRSKLRLKIQQQELLDKNKTMASELEFAYLKLEEFTQSRLHKEIDNQNNVDNSNKESIVSQLVYDSNLYTDDDWTEFRSLFEKAHPGYLLRIKDKLPKISVAELRFMAVHKLNLNTNEMALILNISPDAVRKSKKRLSLKIAQNLNQSFDEFTNSIL